MVYVNGKMKHVNYGLVKILQLQHIQVVKLNLQIVHQMVQNVYKLHHVVLIQKQVVKLV
jgi:hypothetical protein